jgi:hypothetical protein
MTLPLDLNRIAARYGYAARLDPRSGTLRSIAAKAWASCLQGWSGTIRAHSRDLLEASCDQPRLFPELAGLRDVRVLDRSDDELRITFPPERLPQVAQAMGIRTRAEVRANPPRQRSRMAD